MEEHDLKPEDIDPTGPQGIILKGDVLAAIASGGQKQTSAPQKQPEAESKSQPQPKGVGESSSKGPPPKEAKEHSDRQLEASKAGPAKASQPPSGAKAGSRKGKGARYTDIPNSQIRKIIAQRLLESKQQIPAMYVSATADVDAVSALRQSLKDQGKKVSLAALLVTAYQQWPVYAFVSYWLANLSSYPCQPTTALYAACKSSTSRQQMSYACTFSDAVVLDQVRLAHVIGAQLFSACTVTLSCQQFLVVQVSVNDFVIRAAALALKAVPQANAQWDPKNEEVRLVDGVDISIAVATDSGLITPIVAQANTKSLTQISTEVKELAGRARENKLKPNEFQGGSFSISNLGMYGVDRFSAIINPPQACIMAVGGSVKHIVMQNGKPVVKTRMTVTLSADNRVYDGEVAAQFLQEFCNTIANPVKMLS